MRTIPFPNTSVKVKDILFEDTFSTIAKGELQGDNNDKILRIQKEKTNLNSDSFFLNEIEVCQTFPNDSFLRLESVLKNSNSYCLVYENTNFPNLIEWVSNSQIAPGDFLKFALTLANSLSSIHSQGLIHNRLEPRNIFYKSSSNKLKLFGLGYSSLLLTHDIQNGSSELLSANLHYISPERTGRLRRPVDFRSDLYSLGILFYEILVGSPPFHSLDPLELIHFHIAAKPTPLHIQKPTIPLPISQLVSRLLAKNPDERYQSCEELCGEIKSMLFQYEESGYILELQAKPKNFTEYSRISKLPFPRKEAEDVLGKAISDTRNGKRTCVLFYGESGAGKTSAVMNNLSLFDTFQAVLIHGKFDIDKSNIPYFALKQILSRTLRFLFTKSEADLSEIQQSIHLNIGNSFKLIQNLYPDLAKIYSPNLAPEEKLPNDDLFLFSTLLRFLTLCFRKQEPAIVFLDDIQWSDEASLGFLEYVTKNREWDGILFILSSRLGLDNLGLSKLQKISGQFDTFYPLELNPFSVDEIHTQLQEFLHDEDIDIPKLAATLHEKTLGNLFYLNQLLESIESEKIIYYESLEDKWHVEWPKLYAKSINTQVAANLADQIKGIPKEVLEFLGIAAVVGNRVPVKILFHIYREKLNEFQLVLTDCIKEGFLTQLNPEFKLFPFFQMIRRGMENSPEFQSLLLRGELRFSHDKLRFACLEQFGINHRKEVHYLIAQTMIQFYTLDESTESALYIANHLLEAKNPLLIRDPDFTFLYWKFLRIAGNISRETGAFESAHNYYMEILDISQDLRTDNPRRSENFLILLGLVESKFYTDRTEEAQKLSEYLLEQAQTDSERSMVYLQQINVYNTLNQFGLAYQTGIEALNSLGEPLPKNPGPIRLIFELLKMVFYRRGRSIESLLNDKLNPDPAKREALVIIYGLLNYGKHKDDILFIILFLRLITLSLKYGLSEKSYVGYAGYGTMIFSITFNMEQQRKYWNLSEQILKKLKTEKYYGRFAFGKALLYDYLENPFKEIARSGEESFRKSMQYGDFLNAAFSIFSEILHHIYSASSLSELADNLQELERKSAGLKYTGIPVFVALGEYYYQAFQTGILDKINLREKSYLFPEFEDELLEGIGNGTLNTFYSVLLAHVDYVNGRYNKILERFNKYQPDLDKSRTLYLYHDFRLFKSLALIRLAEEKKTGLSITERIFVKFTLYQLKKLSKIYPINFITSYNLLKAEYLALIGDTSKASKIYERLLDEFPVQEIHFRRGLAYYHAGLFKIRQNQNTSGILFLKLAEEKFRSWGASELSTKIRRQFLDVSDLSNRLLARTSAYQWKESDSLDFDLLSIIKASQSISSIINPEELQKKLLQTLIENAGATKGYLILNENGKLMVKIGVNLESPLENLPLPLDSSYSFLPIEPIYYSYRTGSKFVINSHTKSSLMTNSSYIRKENPNSILLLPITKQGKVISIIYLENKHIPDIFHPSKIDILEILASQASISFENSRLYSEIISLNADLEKKVEDRTKELMKSLNIIRKDLLYSKKIQTSILPPKSEFPALDFALIYQPMDEVGGDFYDFFEVRPGLIRVFVADATGHGVQAALVTMAIKSEYENLKLKDLNPSQILTSLNNIVISKFKTLYFSCVVVDIDTNNCSLVYSSAGHPSQILSKSGVIQELKKTGALLGLKQGIEYQSEYVQYNRGDRLYLFTDGVYEVFDSTRSEFGEDRFYKLLEQTEPLLPSEQIVSIQNHLIEFQGNGEFEDDLTLLVFNLK
jgi:predicted ATPase/serine phosphatase RsbU (regulator of sigma subunit)